MNWSVTTFSGYNWQCHGTRPCDSSLWIVSLSHSVTYAHAVHLESTCKYLSVAYSWVQGTQQQAIWVCENRAGAEWSYANSLDWKVPFIPSDGILRWHLMHSISPRIHALASSDQQCVIKDVPLHKSHHNRGKESRGVRKAIDKQSPTKKQNAIQRGFVAS